MNNPNEIDEMKVPDVRIDPSLDKYKDIVLFPEKLALANEQIKKSGFPNHPDELPRKKGQ